MKGYLLIATVVLLFSCKKQDDCNLTEQSIVGTYKLTGLTFQPSSAAGKTDMFVSLPECEKDNFIAFNENRSFEKIDIGLSCTPASGQVSTWSLIGTTITFDGQERTVTDFDCNSIEITSPDPAIPGAVHTAIYIRQ